MTIASIRDFLFCLKINYLKRPKMSILLDTWQCVLEKKERTVQQLDKVSKTETISCT